MNFLALRSQIIGSKLGWLLFYLFLFKFHFLNTSLETGGDAAAPSPHELFEEYINRARSIHDMSETDAESSEPSMIYIHFSSISIFFIQYALKDKCDAEAKGKLCLIYHQLQFERYKRQMQWQESRKLFGRFS